MIPPPQVVARNLLKNVVMAIGFQQTPPWEAMLADLELQITEAITQRDAATRQAERESCTIDVERFLSRLPTRIVEPLVREIAAALRAQADQEPS